MPRLVRSRFSRRSHLTYGKIDKPCTYLATLEGPPRWTPLKQTSTGQCSAIARYGEIEARYGEMNIVTLCEQNVLSAGCDWCCIVATAFCVLAGEWNNGRALVSGRPEDAQEGVSEGSRRKPSANSLHSRLQTALALAGEVAAGLVLLRLVTGFTVKLKCD